MTAVAGRRDRDRFDHAIYAAPWKDRGVEYGPVSPRTGRMVNQDTALREYRESFNAIPIREDAEAGGLWDHEQEAALRKQAGCRLPTAPERYDARAMQRFADAHSHEFTDLELQVYTLFWVGKLSYGQIGRQLGGRSKDSIRQAVQRLRARLQGRVRGG